MLRRVLPWLALALVAAAPAGADTIHHRKQIVDAKIATLNAQVARARQKASVLRDQIAGVSAQIRALERQVGDVSLRLAPIERELELREVRLNRLTALYQLQSDRLTFLRRQYRIALDRLNTRLVAIYESEFDDTLSVVLSAESFNDFLDALDYARQIGEQDRLIARTVQNARDRVRVQRAQTRLARSQVRQEAEVIAVRVRQVRGLRDELLVSHQRLTEGRARQRVSLASLTADERAEAEELDSLQAVSAELAAKIRAAQARPGVPSGGPLDTTPSRYGLVWPVSAGITSPFGWRWGRMHEGLDLGASYGSPIHAAAAGTVIYAGWLGGYGNLVVVDHGGGLSTAYGHQSAIAVSVGQHVDQGQVIGYVGSTGHSTGPHLHFEVRVNGSAVDPLGYL
jgi:murein DD-endopeptidase MepM/ murein hydrolase activator NlpD